MHGLTRIALSGLIAGFILAGTTVTGEAQPPPGHPPMGQGGGMKDRPSMSGSMHPGAQPGMMFSPEFFERLGLSADQAAKFKQVRNEYKKESIRRQAEIKIAELELWELVEKPDAKADQIEKKVREVEGKKTDLRVFRFKHLNNVKAIFTPEQFEKFRSMASMMFGHEGGMGYRGMGSRGHGGYGGKGYGQGGYDDSSDED